MRRELLDVETDPRSPERGQYKFVQSLIREVAYGTLARRDRRCPAPRRRPPLTRRSATTSWPASWPSHYLAAREASDEGPEADAITAQARLALSGAADRAAALGAHDQAVAYLDQALAITTEPADRAPLLDRAARSASAASRDSEAIRYAEAAIEAYQQHRRTASRRRAPPRGSGGCYW